MIPAARRSPVSGLQLVAALAAMVFATAVLPPAAAWALNRSRIAQTRERARAAAERLQNGSEAFAGLMQSGGIACGPGRLPDRAPSDRRAREELSHPMHRDWLRDARMAPELFGAGMPTDAWGHCFIVNADAWATGGAVWLLSAGPNGWIDTGTNAMALGGDDIGNRLR
ncbi:MAG TPA: hypothetical protein VMZ90_05115 [Vicinamibacterales bacterium]|nr:hypothetical protein [Vicinamibacterales bacterium]